MKKTGLASILCWSFFFCTAQGIHAPGKSIVVPAGEDLTEFVNRHPRYDEFLLGPGVYMADRGHCMTRSHIIIREKAPGDAPRITEPLQVCGDNNIIDGLCWDADIDKGLRLSDPGTLAISGSFNTVRHCIFRNFRSEEHGNKIVAIGRQLTSEGQFLDTEADSNLIESCTFDNWGLRNEPKGSTKSSTCIAVGREDDKGKFTGTVVRSNLFINGPYMQFGYNAACKVFNSVLLENNIFFGGQECMEIKYGNSTIRGNTIHHFSGYNILANRWGRNNLYEDNTVYDIAPIDSISSAQGFMIWEGGNTVLRNNRIYDCAKAGLILGKETEKNSLMEYVLIVNNYFSNNRRGICFDNKHGSPRHLIITHNRFLGMDGMPGRGELSNYDSAALDYYGDNLFQDSAGNPDAPGISSRSQAGMVEVVQGDPGDASHHVIVYPTGRPRVFHLGLAGLDRAPQALEIIDGQGHRVAMRTFDDPGLMLVPNIDLTGVPTAEYVLKIHTYNGDITARLRCP